MEQHKMSSIKEYLETYFGHFEQGLKDETQNNKHKIKGKRGKSQGVEDSS
jgi:hypothetical protein